MQLIPKSTLTLFWSLGPKNIYRVLKYRLLLRSGIHPVQTLTHSFVPGPVFVGENVLPLLDREMISEEWRSHFLSFGWKRVDLPVDVPDFLESSFGNVRIPASDPWWTIPDFSPSIKDIKLIWEKSRFSWVPIFAQRARAGDRHAIPKLNRWVENWQSQNPPYLGPNWKCGQEASLRILNLALGATILHQTSSLSPALVRFLVVHVDRILPTVGYAIGQCNNHATSEAAAIYVAGSWLTLAKDDQATANKGRKLMKKGQDLLEKLAIELFDPDGGFSMTSINYHRLALDTFSAIEIWRRTLSLQPFSARMVERIGKAVVWLNSFIDQTNGEVPNMGANDGSLLMGFSGLSLLDFRPSVGLASALFLNAQVHDSNRAFQSLLLWFGIARPCRKLPPQTSVLHAHTGFGILRRGQVLAVLRLPRNQWRPNQADALHLDMWIAGENVLRDAGTFSYGWPDETQPKPDFGATRQHNTIEFDGRDQMRKRGNFLYENWIAGEIAQGLKTEKRQDSLAFFYHDAQGAKHLRRVALEDNRLVVVDEFAGFSQRAVLRWRLSPGNWVLTGQQLKRGAFKLSVTSTIPIKRIEVVQGTEARCYLEQTSLPVLEVECNQPGSISTELSWTDPQ